MTANDDPRSCADQFEDFKRSQEGRTAAPQTVAALRRERKGQDVGPIAIDVRRHLLVVGEAVADKRQRGIVVGSVCELFQQFQRGDLVVLEYERVAGVRAVVLPADAVRRNPGSSSKPKEPARRLAGLLPSARSRAARRSMC